MLTPMRRPLLLALALSLSAPCGIAQLRLPAILGDGMVLQQKTRAPN